MNFYKNFRKRYIVIINISLVVLFSLITNIAQTKIAFAVYSPIEFESEERFYNQYNAFLGQSGFVGKKDNPIDLIASLISYALSFLGVIFVILVIYAGFLWMTARGDSDQVSKAKDIMINAVIGIIIVLSAYVITSFIITSLGSATGS